MDNTILSAREMTEGDPESIVRYWLDADVAFLQGMGVDLSKMPDREHMIAALSEQLGQSYEEKKSYCTIWEVDGQPVGHSNVNKIIYGQEAYMHLHLWKPNLRQKGLGANLVKLSLPYFFRNLDLQTLYCEPYALNPAPNKTLEKVGFLFLDTYVTIPGWLNFEQPVNRWILTRERFETL